MWPYVKEFQQQRLRCFSQLKAEALCGGDKGKRLRTTILGDEEFQIQADAGEERRENAAPREAMFTTLMAPRAGANVRRRGRGRGRVESPRLSCGCPCIVCTSHLRVHLSFLHSLLPLSSLSLTLSHFCQPPPHVIRPIKTAASPHNKEHFFLLCFTCFFFTSTNDFQKSIQKQQQ